MNIQHLAFIQNLRAPELILIFLVVLLLFGAKRLPELFKSFGKSIKEFKKATSDIENDVRSAMDAEDEPTHSPRAESKQVEASTTAAKASTTAAKASTTAAEASTTAAEASTTAAEAPKSDDVESKKEDT